MQLVDITHEQITATLRSNYWTIAEQLMAMRDANGQDAWIHDVEDEAALLAEIQTRNEVDRQYGEGTFDRWRRRENHFGRAINKVPVDRATGQVKLGRGDRRRRARSISRHPVSLDPSATAPRPTSLG